MRIIDDALAQEVKIKEKRLAGLLERHGFDSFVMTNRINIAWITAGGRAIAPYGEPTSPVFLIFTPRHKWAVGYGIDLPRTMDEELAGLGFEPVSLPTFGKTMPEAVCELVSGRVAADAAFPGAADIGPLMRTLYEPLLEPEMQRYATAAETTGRILSEMGYWVKPGMTERQVMAEMWKRFIEAGHEGRYMFLGSDERIRKYRHAVFTDKPIDKAVLLAPCTARWGLDLPTSRLVYFGEPPEDIRRRFLAVATMQATMTAMLKPGLRMIELRRAYLELFDRFGYPEEKTVHFHGGPIGYGGSGWDRLLDGDETVQANTAYTFFFTVAGAKSEEVILVGEDRTWIASAVQPWPLLEIPVGDQTVAIPDMLVR